MTRLSRISSFASLALAAALCITGCHSNPSIPTPAEDPAQANLAPATYTTTGGAPPSNQAPTDQSSTQAPSYPPSNQVPSYNDGSQGSPSGSNGAPSGNYDDSQYAPQPVASAPQPPPPMPDYQQPPCPGPGFIWTPGYWGYQPTGYSWVPGAWTRPPYQGALWTPGYWGHRQNKFLFYPGHWGKHMGFYGGVNYGNGYVGTGYEGGYWDRDHFDYNRAVNNIDPHVVPNVYNYANFNPGLNVRISFNGGPDGIQFRPRPLEMVAWREFEGDRDGRGPQERAVGHEMHPYGPPGQEHRGYGPPGQEKKGEDRGHGEGHGHGEDHGHDH
jgi:hypothetical protein